jgi:hypothetical protein
MGRLSRTILISGKSLENEKIVAIEGGHRPFQSEDFAFQASLICGEGVF